MTEPPKAKRRLTKAGRAAIVAALKKRWAAKKVVSPKPNLVATKKAVGRKTAVKVAPATAAKKAVTGTTAKVAATPKTSPPAETKHPVKKAAKKSAPVPAQPIATAESAASPVVAI